MFEPTINVATVSTSIYGTNDLDTMDLDIMTNTSTIIDKHGSIVIADLDSFSLRQLLISKNNKPIDIQFFLSSVEDSGKFEVGNYFRPSPDQVFERRLSIRKIVDSPYLIFAFTRKEPDGNVVLTPILPSKTIILESGRNLFLLSVVVYTPGHYTCYIRCDNDWWYYNDNPGGKPTFRRIGSYEDMIKQQQGIVLTNGVEYYYGLSNIRNFFLHNN